MRLRGTILITGGPEEMLKAAPRIIKEAHHEAIRGWHRLFMPEHFTTEGGRKYKYQPRVGQDEPSSMPRLSRWAAEPQHQRTVNAPNPHYYWRKRREKGHFKPLVWSGATEAMAKGPMKLGGNAKRAFGVISVPKYFYQYLKAGPHERKQKAYLHQSRYRGVTYQERRPAGIIKFFLKHDQPDKVDELTRTTPAEIEVLRHMEQQYIAKAMSQLRTQRMRRIAA